MFFILMWLFSPGAAWAGLPAEAQAMLDAFPEKKITLDLVIGRAIEASDSYRELQASLPGVAVPELQSRALFDPRLSVKVARVVDNNEPQSPFNPQKIVSSRLSLGGSKYFSTGTSASAEISHGSTDLAFVQIPSQFFHETKANISLSQNLWQDAFGYGARRAHEAGRLTKDAMAMAYEGGREEWTTALIGVFYGAWLAQSQAHAAQSSVKRRERLLDVTRIKLKRGTAEQPDLLQVESAHLAAKVYGAEADQRLSDRWRSLVFSLKLPMAWLAIDSKEIPIALDEPVKGALAGCGEASSQAGAPSETSETRRLGFLSQSALLKAERARNAVAPDLKFNVALTSNGIDPSRRDTTIGEVFSVKHPAWTIGLSLTAPVFGSAEEALVRSAMVESIKSETQVSLAADILRQDWLTACSNLRRLDQARGLLSKALDNQQKRVELEEQRFEIGRTTTLAVIQAGDDATGAETQLRVAEAETRLASWRVHRLKDGYKSFFGRLLAGEGRR